MKIFITSLLGLSCLFGFSQATTNVLGGGVCLNEILPDPNGAMFNFDTDGNGTPEDDDEFVELYNLSGGTINISGYQLWDSAAGNWYTFPGGTFLGAGNYAVVIIDVQAGGSLPPVSGGNLAFNANTTSLMGNGGDNVVLYDPGMDEYIQLRYNGDMADDPTTYGGFSATATIVGSVEDFGSDTDGQSRVREPSGDINIVTHDVSTPGGNASPGFPVELEFFSVD